MHEYFTVNGTLGDTKEMSRRSLLIPVAPVDDKTSAKVSTKRAADDQCQELVACVLVISTSLCATTFHTFYDMFSPQSDVYTNTTRLGLYDPGDQEGAYLNPYGRE